MDVKKEIEKVNGVYSETMDMYKIIKNYTAEARRMAKSLEQRATSDGEELIRANPHTSIYKILDAIDEFNKHKNG